MARKGHGNGSAGAAALHAMYARGNQTPLQIRAEQLNLLAARQAAAAERIDGSTVISFGTPSENYDTAGMGSASAKGVDKAGMGTPSKTGYSKASGARGARAAQDDTYLDSMHHHAAGTRWSKYRAKAPPKKPSIAGGGPARFISVISPGSYMGRTRWAKASSTRFVPVVKLHVGHAKRLKHWKVGGRVVKVR